MMRPRSLRVLQRAAGVLPRLPALKAAHPCGGDRRLWADLHVIERRSVNKQQMLRLRREHHLLGAPNLRLQAKRP
jgi:hypothetical protein